MSKVKCFHRKGDHPRGEKFKKAYTLVELLIVMVIFAVLAAMGIAALQSFRDGAQFRSATLEFEKTIDEVRNLARNNVVSRSNTIDPNTDPETSFNVQISGYFLDLAAPNPVADPTLPVLPFRLYSCRDGNFDPLITIDQIKCNTPEDWVLLNRENFRRITVTTTCAGTGGVFFRNASSDLFIHNDSIITTGVAKSSFNSLTAINSCTITLTHISGGSRVSTYTITENGNRFFRI